MPSTIGVGVVGYGGSAKNFHLPFITSIPDYRIAAILQRSAGPSDPRSAEKGSHCTVDFPEAKHHRESEAFFADPNIDLVVVATRGDTHTSFAEKALLAGKHVIVDKPFAESSEDADHVIQLSKDRGLILTCFQNRRWDGDFQTLNHLLSLGALGEVMEAEIHYDFDAAPWLGMMTQKEYTPGSGMAFGLGTHSIDQALVLFGLPSSITAFLRSQRGIESEVEDSFTIILQYEGEKKNLLVTIKTSVTSPMEKQLKYLIRGTKGSYVKWQQRSTCRQEEDIGKGLRPLDEGFGRELESLRGTLTTYNMFDEKVQQLDPETGRYVGQYPTIPGRWVGIYENVASAILGKAELNVLATQSRNAIRVIELARKSHTEGVTVRWQ